MLQIWVVQYREDTLWEDVADRDFSIFETCTCSDLLIFVGFFVPETASERYLFGGHRSHVGDNYSCDMLLLQASFKGRSTGLVLEMCAG